jgi:hypothetical protein
MMSTFAYAFTKNNTHSNDDTARPTETQERSAEKPVSHHANSTLFNLNKIAIQPKLKVSKPGDEYEQEAVTDWQIK